MQTKLIALISSILLMGGSFYAGQVSVEPMSFGAMTETKQQLLEENVEQSTRLKEAPTWDTSIITSSEISQAYIDVAIKYKVSEMDVKETGGNLQTAIQKKMAEQSVLCSDPYSKL